MNLLTEEPRGGDAERVGGDEAPSDNGWCAKCGDETPVSGFARDVAQHLNQVLKRIGGPPFTRRNTVLCDECSSRWRADRIRFSNIASERESDARRTYKTERKAGGDERDALSKVPPYIRDDHMFSSWRRTWETWFETRGSKNKNDGKAYGR